MEKLSAARPADLCLKSCSAIKLRTFGYFDFSQDFGCGLPLRSRPQTTSIWSWRRDLNP
jgi:hypothetical protein